MASNVWAIQSYSFEPDSSSEDKNKYMYVSICLPVVWYCTNTSTTYVCLKYDNQSKFCYRVLHWTKWQVNCCLIRDPEGCRLFHTWDIPLTSQRLLCFFISDPNRQQRAVKSLQNDSQFSHETPGWMQTCSRQIFSRNSPFSFNK